MLVRMCRDLNKTLQVQPKCSIGLLEVLLQNHSFEPFLCHSDSKTDVMHTP